MRTKISSLFLALLLSLALTSCHEKQSSSSSTPAAPEITASPENQPTTTGEEEIAQIKAPPLPPFNPQQPKRIQLTNGMVIFLQEDHELPLVDGYVLIRGGSR